MVVEILVTHPDPEDPLPEQRFEPMLRRDRVPLIVEAASHPPDHVRDPVGRLQKEGSSVRGHPPTVKSGHDPTSSGTLKPDRSLRPLSHGESRSLTKSKLLHDISLQRVNPPPRTTVVSDPG